MKIKGWEKISGFTYKGYSIVNPMHNANEDVYYATILNLNHSNKQKWDIELTFRQTGRITFRILDNITTLLLAKSHLTKPKIETLKQFREQYEMLVDDILESVQSYTATKVTKNINGGTTGIINQVQNASTNFTYGTNSISVTNIQSNAIQALQTLQQQIDDNNKKL
jgi:hypothetical protein